MDFRDTFLERFRWVHGHADMLGLLAEAAFLEAAVKALAEPFASRNVTKVAAVEARGFVLAGGAALELGAGFVPIRKRGSIHPGENVERTTSADWRGRTHVLCVQRESLGPPDTVVLVDDWAETGSQAMAARSLLEDCGATYAGLSLLVDQLPEAVRRSLGPVHAVVLADDLPPSG